MAINENDLNQEKAYLNIVNKELKEKISDIGVSLYQQESARHGSCFYDESVLHDGIVHSEEEHHQKQNFLLRLHPHPVL